MEPVGPFTVTGLSPKAKSPREDLYVNLSTVLPVNTRVYLNLKQFHWVFNFFFIRNSSYFLLGASSQHEYFYFQGIECPGGEQYLLKKP